MLKRTLFIIFPLAITLSACGANTTEQPTQKEENSELAEYTDADGTGEYSFDETHKVAVYTKNNKNNILEEGKSESDEEDFSSKYVKTYSNGVYIDYYLQKADQDENPMTYLNEVLDDIEEEEEDGFIRDLNILDSKTENNTACAELTYTRLTDDADILEDVEEEEIDIENIIQPKNINEFVKTEVLEDGNLIITYLRYETGKDFYGNDITPKQENIEEAKKMCGIANIGESVRHDGEDDENRFEEEADKKWIEEEAVEKTVG